MTERRRFSRFETALNAICEIVSEKCKTHSKVQNISKDGALLILDRSLPQGAELNLSMDVPGDNVPVFATCEVAWQEGLKSDDAYRTGVKFTMIDSLNKGRLLEHIYSQWLKFLDKR